MKDRIVSFKDTWSSLDFNKKALTVLAGGVIATAASFSVWHATKPDYMLFMADIEPRNMPQILTTLDSNKINYKVGRNNSILIDSAEQDMATAAIAKEGIPSQNFDGYELLNSAQSVYTSQIKENLFRNQVLEEELSKLINSIDGIQESKVKLALAKESQFLRDSAPATASVVLTLNRGVRLTTKQVQGITNIVARGIPNLPPENVVVLDQTGRMISQSGDSFFGSSPQEYRNSYETELRQKIIKIIAPIVGVEALRVNVSASFNFDKIENTTQQPTEPTVILSEQSEVSYDKSLNGGEGVPGALSNQPPEHADYSDKSSSAPASQSDSAGKSHEKTIKNFTVGNSITHTKSASGILRDVSVAVLIDDQIVQADTTGKLLNKVQSLVEATISFKEDRDKILVQSINFNTPEVIEPKEPEFYETKIFSDAIETGKVGLGLLAFYLIFWRPLLNRIAPISSKPKKEDDKTPVDSESKADNEPKDIMNLVSDTNNLDEQYSYELNKASGIIENNLPVALEIVKGMIDGKDHAKIIKGDESDDSRTDTTDNEDQSANTSDKENNA